MPTMSQPMPRAAYTAPWMTALSPGASPPPVLIATFLMASDIVNSSFQPCADGDAEQFYGPHSGVRQGADNDESSKRDSICRGATAGRRREPSEWRVAASVPAGRRWRTVGNVKVRWRGRLT